MIRSLSIRNYAIIDNLEINFSDNLTIITGETGAGKSIILGALGLILGNRADTKILYNQSEKCVVEAICSIAAYNLETLFEEEDIDYEDETVIRREILPSGKSRAFINDTPVKLTTLERLSDSLIDLHQQFDTLDIQDIRFQLRVVDALANHKPALLHYQQKFRLYEHNRRLLDKLVQRTQDADKESDFLRFQLDELRKASLQEGEQEELEQLQKQLSNAEDIKRVLQMAVQLLSESENAVTNQLSGLMRDVHAVAEFHPQLPALAERLDSFRYELDDIAGELQGIADDTEYDGERLAEIDTRLNLIYKLLKKHNATTLESLLSYQAELEAKLGGYEDLSEQIAQLEEQLTAQERELWGLGEQLSASRKAIVANFEDTIHQLLHQLSMQYARIQVQIEPHKQLTINGIDNLQFLFAANKGSRLEPIKSVASGGELSRLALCIKSLVANAIPLPTLIFDEIDSGVSGEVAYQMGLILQQLASEHQIITITHSPQIAAKANVHYFVHKIVQGERTITGIRALSPDERITEIAKMLSGNPPTESAKLNARELLAR